MTPARCARDLPTSGTQALEHAVVNACRAMMPLDADDEIIDPHEHIWPSLLNCLTRGVVQHIQRWNSARSPIVRLSVELLHMIFEHVELPDRVTVSRICHTWREVSKRCPIVVPWDLDQRPTELLGMLRSTAPAPLCFEALSIRRETSKTIARCIRDHMHRTRVLDIEICDSNVHRSLWSALQQPAPQLQVLRIADGGFFITAVFPVAKFLSSNAPQLTTCFFAGWGGLQGTFNMCSRFPSIRTLVFSSCVGWAEIITAFTSFPLLETLSIDVLSWFDPGDPDYEGPPFDVPPVVKARLAVPASMRFRHFAIICDDSQVPACVLSAIAHNQLKMIAIGYKGGYCPDHSSARRTGTNLVSLLSPGTTSAVHISCSGDPLRNKRFKFSIRIEGSDGRVRVHRGLRHESLQHVLSRLPDNVSSLTVTDWNLLLDGYSDYYGDHYAGWATLQLPASIRTLTVVVYADALEEGEDGLSSGWLLTPVLHLSDPDCIAFSLPEDEDIEDSAPPIVPAAQLAAFLRDTIQRTTTRRLPCVLLQGLLPDDLSALEDYADEILVEPPLRGYVAPEDDVLTFDNWP